MQASRKDFYLDPARFKHRVTFWQETAVSDGAGGYKAQLTAVLTTWGAKDKARTTLSYNDLLGIAAGAVMEGRDIELYIRYRNDFQPTKGMRLQVGEEMFLLSNPGVQIGEPVKYIRVVGKRVER